MPGMSYDEIAKADPVTADLALRLGDRLGHRRAPRVRVRKGRKGAFAEIAGPFRTKRAALRNARQMRDTVRGDSKPQLVVYRVPTPPDRRAERWMIGRSLRGCRQPG